MSFNINAGRLRHFVEFLVTPNGSDVNGDPLPPTTVFSARAEVQVKSGNQLVDYGTALTSEVITVLMWYDPRATNDQILKWNNIDYQIQHIRPDAELKEMIVTATVERK